MKRCYRCCINAQTVTHHGLVFLLPLPYYFSHLLYLLQYRFPVVYNPPDEYPNMPTDRARVPGSLSNKNTGSRINAMVRGTRDKKAGLFHEEMILFFVNGKFRPIKINKMRVTARKNGSYNIMCKHRSVIKSLDGPTKHYQCDVTRCGPISF